MPKSLKIHQKQLNCSFKPIKPLNSSSHKRRKPYSMISLQVNNSKKQASNQVTELTIKQLELELLNKKAEIELLKLRFPERNSDTNRSMYG